MAEESAVPVQSSPAAKRKRNTPSKKEKDPDAPKKPLSSYMLFAQEQRPVVKANHPEMSFGEITKLLSVMWSKVDKAVYEERAHKQFDEYKQQKSDYEHQKSEKEKQAVVAEKEVADETEAGEKDADEKDVEKEEVKPKKAKKQKAKENKENEKKENENKEEMSPKMSSSPIPASSQEKKKKKKHSSQQENN